MKFAKFVVGVALAGLVVAACGGSDSPEPPTSVSAADLDRGGTLWDELTPDLKDEVVRLAKERAADERPDAATQFLAGNTGQLVREIDKQYANEAKRSTSIYDTYESVRARLGYDRFNDAMNKIDQLGIGPMSRRTRVGLAVLVGAGLAVGGCGGDERDAATEPVRVYFDALADADGDRACEQLSGDARREFVGYLSDLLPEAGLVTCAEGIALLGESVGDDERSRLTDATFEVELDGDRARVKPDGGDRWATVEKIDGRWYITGGITAP